MEAISQALANSNLMRYLPTVILPAIGDTLKMVLVSAILSIFFGIILGIILVMTADNGLSPHRHQPRAHDSCASSLRSLYRDS